MAECSFDNVVLLIVQGMEDSYQALAHELKGSHVRVANFQADIEREFSEQNFGLKTFPTIVFLPKDKPGFIRYPSERRDTDTLKMWLTTVAGRR